MIEVLTLAHGSDRFGQTLDRIRANRALVQRWYEDAESKWDELDHPGVRLAVTFVDGAPAAWAGSRLLPSGVLKCICNYEVPLFRGHGLYAMAHQRRHEDTVKQFPYPKETYLFGTPPFRTGPIALHAWNGWRFPELAPDTHGVSDMGHEWWKMIRN